MYTCTAAQRREDEELEQAERLIVELGIEVALVTVALLRELALEHYRAFTGRDAPRTPSDTFVRRVTENCVRHRLTNYHALLEQMPSAVANSVLKHRVTAAIRLTYAGLIE